MGLLTDPNTSRGGLIEKIRSNYGWMSWTLYGCGILSYFVMVHPEYSAKTYFSENALLPGLVQGEFHLEREVKSYLEDLQYEAERYPNSVPFPYLEAKLRQMGLEVYTHNFTLNYPLGSSERKFTGTNLYAILRAPRASSTESLVMSVPYRPPISPDTNTLGSLALLLGAARFFKGENYWAKDLIFLITQHEQLGAQAWLEAYHGTTCGIPGVLDRGDLEARAGAIQAAVNLEISDGTITHLNVKVEGLNGQLPNLDLVNLINRLCLREGVRQMFQGVEDHPRPDTLKGYIRSLSTFTNMVLKQATGVPSGNHGLFHRFGIEAVTIEGVVDNGTTKKRNRHPIDFHSLGRIIEGVFRSLNNLLERFHQSFFFYLLPSSNRYVSIGMYMPAMGLLGSAFVLSALGIWLRITETNHGDGDKKQQPIIPQIAETPELSCYIPVFILTHLGGFFLIYLPHPASYAGSRFELSAEDSIFYALAIYALIAGSIPILVKSYLAQDFKDWRILKCFVSLELAILAYSVSLCNFGLAYLISALIIPTTLISGPSSSRISRLIRAILTLATHPLVLLFIFCAIDTASVPILWSGDPIKLFVRSFEAFKRALMYSVVDGYIYGNVSFNIASVFFFPCWTQLWCLVFLQDKNKTKKKKID